MSNLYMVLFLLLIFIFVFYYITVAVNLILETIAFSLDEKNDEKLAENFIDAIDIKNLIPFYLWFKK